MNRSWHFQLLKNRRKPGFITGDDKANLSTKTTSASTMDPTTLVTFLFRAPPEAYSVELVGSWDNFQQSYRMHHDRRRGRGHWSGCFTFDNIVFDGEKLDWSKPRTGGLKQGGTYWYFYRLNDETEAYDDSQTYTTSCPLLPGQRLNIIDVPIEIQDLPPRCFSAGGAKADELAREVSFQTLDPGDKFMPLAPPPVSKVHGRCISDLAINGRLENGPHLSKPKEISPPVSPPSQLEQPNPYSKRFYASDRHDFDGYPEERSPLSTAGTWSSQSPSFAHSSVVDVQARAFSGIGSDNGDLSPVQEASSPDYRGMTSVSYQEDVALEQSNSDSFVDFDEDQAAFNDDFDAFIQIPSSRSDQHDRLSTSRGSASFQEEHSRRLKPGSFDETADAQAPPQSSRFSTDTADREYRTAPYDVLSPSFSAATMSSAGLSTPFHLSAGCSRTTSVHTPEPNGEEAMNHVVTQLRQLQSSYSEHVHHSPPLYERRDPSLSGYSLPPAVETETVKHQRDFSLQSKTSLAPSDVGIVSHRLEPLATFTMPGSDDAEGSSSFADNVFNELTFFS